MPFVWTNPCPQGNGGAGGGVISSRDAAHQASALNCTPPAPKLPPPGIGLSARLLPLLTPPLHPKPFLLPASPWGKPPGHLAVLFFFQKIRQVWFEVCLVFFLQQKKLFIWNMHYQYKSGNCKTYTLLVSS